MILGFAEDFTNTVELDSDLLTSDSGLFLNRGIHPSITVNNLLHFLPNVSYTFDTWDSGTTYNKYETTRKRTDIVTYNDIIYQSLSDSNSNNQPDISSSDWLETNIDSLRLKSFVYSVQDKAKADLNIVRRLIDAQDLYIVDEDATEQTLPNDYAGWAFEPKGSDYVTIKLNSVSFRKSGTTPVNLYVINQGTLVTTLSVTPTNGTVSFQDLNYTFKGKGKWIFAVDSTTAFIGGGFVDPLKYDGFVAYTCNGIGDAPEDATYSYGVADNGLNFNVTAYLDTDSYISNNFVNYGQFIRSTFELESLNMFLANANNRSNLEQRIQMDRDLLIAEAKEMNMNTVAYRYEKEKKKAVSMLEKTLDKHLSTGNGLKVRYSSI